MTMTMMTRYFTQSLAYLLNYLLHSQKETVVTKKCRTCLENKGKNCFSEKKIDCKTCFNEISKKRSATPEGFVNKLYDSIRTSDIKMKNRVSGETMSREQFDQLVDQPSCYLSGIKLELAPYSQFQLSIERINNEEAHTYANSKPMCLLFQCGCAQWTPLKFELVKSSLQYDQTSSVIDLATLAELKNPPAKRKGISKGLMKTSVSADGLEESCRKCGIFFPLSSYTTHRELGCKTCRLESKKIRVISVLASLRRLFSNAKSNAKKKDRKECSLTLDNIIDMYIVQGGRCFYSKMPMTTQGDWKVSLERLDPRGMYHVNNTKLVCVEFNAIDRSITNKDVNVVSLGWSRELVNKVFTQEQDRVI